MGRFPLSSFPVVSHFILGGYKVAAAIRDQVQGLKWDLQQFNQHDIMNPNIVQVYLFFLSR